MPVILDRPGLRPAGWSEAELRELVNALTRRRFLGGALGLGALALLPACGDEGADPTATVDLNAGFPRTIRHALGDTVIPTRP